MMKDFLNNFFFKLFISFLLLQNSSSMVFSKDATIKNFKKNACLIKTKKDNKEDKVFHEIKCKNNYSITLPEVGFDSYLCRYNFQKIEGLKQSLRCKVFEYNDEIFIK